jgi:endonuclease/exonuclease/phosphatase family metal-dependent hydrolase
MTLKIMTYNILNGGTGREQLILEVIRMVGPDVVLLQEVMDVSIVRNLADSLGLHYFIAKGNSPRHLALLSRYSLVFQNNYHPFPLRTTLLEAAIECVSGQYVYLFGVHLKAHYFSILDELRRIREVQTILKRVARYKEYPCLIGGDFNSIGDDNDINNKALPARAKIMMFLQGGHILRRALSKLDSAGFIDCYRYLRPGDKGFTLPPPTPHVRLDYIFADQKLVGHILECKVVTDSPILHRASDHYPLVAKFDL